MSSELTESRGHDLAVRHYSGFERVGGGVGAEGGLDGSRLNQFLRANAKLFLGIMAFSIGLAVLFTLMMPPAYTSHASVMLDQRKRQLNADPRTAVQLDVVSPLPASDTSAVDTEVELLNSPQMAYQVARLAHWVPDVDYSQLTSDQQRNVGELLKQMARRTRIARVGLTYMIDVAFTAQDPQEAQRIANFYTQAYVSNQVREHELANARAIEQLKLAGTDLQSQVRAADGAVASFKTRSGLNGNTAAGTLTEQEISTYNQNLAVASAQAAQDGQFLATARNQLAKGAEHMGTISAPALQALRAQQQTASAQVAQLSSREGPNHPELMSAKRQLADLNREIAAESSRYLAGLEAQAASSSRRASEMAHKLNATQAELQRADRESVGLHDLQSKVIALQTQLDANRLRLAQVTSQSGEQQSDARIVTTAQLPIQRSSPSWPLNIILGAFFGFLVFGIVVFYRVVFAVGVGSPGEVESLFGVDFLAAIPTLKKMDDFDIAREVVVNTRSLYSEAIRSLSSGIFSTPGQRSLVVAVTSPMSGDGKTTTAIALGRSLALRGRSVVIVDCDLYRPSFENRFGIGASGIGLSEVLAGRASLEQALEPDPMTKATFLPFGNPDGAELTLDHGAFKALISDLRERFDIVLLDLPALLQAAEGRVIAAESDGVIVLARFRETARQSIELTISALQRSGTAIFGLVLTGVPSNSEIMIGGYGAPRQPAQKFLGRS